MDSNWNPWRDRRFLTFATGNTINNIGEAIYAVALPLLVYDITGSLAAMSVLMAIVPASLLLGPLVGAVVDRYGSRVTVVPGLLVQLTAAVCLNLLALTDDPPVWPLFLFGVLVQMGGVSYQAGWMAGVATLFPQNAVRARGSLGTLYMGTHVVGPLLIAVLLPLTGYGALLWINVLTFVAPIVVWLLGIQPPPPSADQGSAPARGLAQDIREGARMMAANHRLMAAVVARLPLLFVGTTGTMALALFLLRDHWKISPANVSLVLVLVRGGVVTGSLFISQRRHFNPKPIVLVYALGSMIFLAIMGTSALPVFLLGFVGLFVLQGVCGVAADMMIFKYMPAQYVGRASGLIDMAEGVPTLLSPLIVPLLYGAVGRTGLFLGFASIALLAVFWITHKWRAWDEPQSAPQAVTVTDGKSQ